uniref:Lysine-specific metallo-endopeptidase domain-containing protein n=1 Tax=Amphimedon queenslandica TaxID=400682 RepID=A0A1X7UIZ9_AMPQE
MYRTWFGKYKRRRARKVKRVCRKCERKLRRKSVCYTINPSGCKSTWNAYVTYFRRRNVNLCPGFHNYGVFCVSSGSATKEGILAHEWTHNFGRTKDFAYGADANKNLARSKPRKAVRNADTYESSITDASQCKSIKPDHIKAYIKGAESTFKLGRYRETLEWCEDGIKDIKKH